MIRLAASLVTVASLSLPVMVYQSDDRKAETDYYWYSHTYRARSLAERIARRACSSLPVAGEVDAFATATSDNRSQVARVAAMRAALAAGDMAEVLRVAEDAIAEEDRLLPLRESRDIAQRKLVHHRVTYVWIGGMVAAIFQAFQSWVDRRSLLETAARVRELEAKLGLPKGGPR